MKLKVSIYSAKSESKVKVFLAEHGVKTLFMQGSDKRIRVVPAAQNEKFLPNWRKQEIIGGKYHRAARYIAAKEEALKASKYFTEKH